MGTGSGGGAAAGVAILATGGGAASAQDQPATISVNAACYVTTAKSRPTITITGSGFGPGDTVDISDTTGTLYTTVTATATGTITATAKAPADDFTKPGEKSDTITATDYSPSGATIVGTATTEVADLLVAANKTRKAPGLKALTFKTKWEFSGFAEGQPIYGHYLYGGKVVATQRFGTAQGACGLLTVHKPLFPARPRHREYKMQLDTSRHYSKSTTPHLISTVGLGLF